jgi:hypothetical protein
MQAVHDGPERDLPEMRELRWNERLLMSGGEGAMSTILQEFGIETLHDQVVSLVAQRWAKAFQCKVTISTGLERSPWVNQRADIMGWTFGPRGNSMLWIAEVETEASLLEPNLRAGWKHRADLGVPFYLFVPRGCREAALKHAISAEITFNGVYEYSFVNSVFQLL